MYQKEVWVALKAARAGAAVVRQAFGTKLDTQFKSDANPVTDIDHAAEEHVLNVIHHHFPADSVLAEESGGAAWESERVWLVDPLDGTVNFIHAIPHVSVSVALWCDGSPAAAVVIDVMHGEELTASKGGGAFSGSNPIAVSPQRELSHSLIATGFAYDRNVHGRAYAENMGHVLTRVQGIRRLGSSALDFGWVAAGRYEGYWEFGLQPWDAAAGILLVTEAGGRVTNHQGGAFQLGDPGVVASNGWIHDDLLAVVQIAPPGHLT
ncbi:MAG TPA: inositol monophosphatase family protein [Acidimicrobiia bacterium]|nr:inositol monophosphatase family protein [Acidimicrobiia bacterium]